MSTQKLSSILYAEDDSMIRELVVTVMEHMTDFEFVACEDGVTALEAAKTRSFDLIILDVMMPGMDGVSAFKKLREDRKNDHTAIMLMTAKIQSHEVESYKSIGVSSLITKPFDATKLPDSIHTIWERIQDPGQEDWSIVSIK